jgi:hypothetical protein
MTETFFGQIFGPIYSIGAESNAMWATLVLLIAVSTKRVLFTGFNE